CLQDRDTARSRCVRHPSSTSDNGQTRLFARSTADGDGQAFGGGVSGQGTGLLGCDRKENECPSLPAAVALGGQSQDGPVGDHLRRRARAGESKLVVPGSCEHVHSVAGGEQGDRSRVGHPYRCGHQVGAVGERGRIAQACVGGDLALPDGGVQGTPGRFRGRGKGTLRQGGDGQGPGCQIPGGEGCGGIQVMGGDQDLGGGIRGWTQHQERTQERSRSEQSGDRPPAAVQETDECVAVAGRGWGGGVGHETTLDRGAGPFGVVHRAVFRRTHRKTPPGSSPGGVEPWSTADESVSGRVSGPGTVGRALGATAGVGGGTAVLARVSGIGAGQRGAVAGGGAVVGAVEAGPLEDATHRGVHLAQAALALGADGEGIVTEALHYLHPSITLGTRVLVRRHGSGPPCWHSHPLTAKWYALTGAAVTRPHLERGCQGCATGKSHRSPGALSPMTTRFTCGFIPGRGETDHQTGHTGEEGRNACTPSPGVATASTGTSWGSRGSSSTNSSSYTRAIAGVWGPLWASARS